MSRDEALRALRGALVDAPHGVAVLVGPPGPVRGAVMQALVEELGSRFPSASLRRPTLPPGGLWMELAARLDLDGGYDAKRRVLRLAAELADQGRGILVVVEGADVLPGESLYGLLGVAQSEPGFYLLLGWPNDGAAQPLPEGLFVAKFEGTAGFPVPDAEPADASPLESPGSADTRPLESPRSADTRPLVSPRFADRPRRIDGPRLPDAPLAAAHPIPRPPPSPSFAFPPEDDDDLPIRARTTRAPGALQRTAWVTSGLAVGFLIGAFIGSGMWRAIAEPDAPLASAGAPRAGAPSEPPTSLAGDDADEMAQRVARRSEPTVPAGRAPSPEVAASAAATVPSPAPAPPPAEVAKPSEPRSQPGVDVAAAPPPAPDQSAPAPTEAPPLEPNDLVPAPDAAPPAPGSAPPPPRANAPVPAPTPTFSRSGPLAEGRLSVRSETPVLIEIDGRPLGPAPLAGIALTRGEHRVIAQYADGSVALKTIYLAYEDVSISFR